MASSVLSAIKEYFELLLINTKVKCLNLAEFSRIVIRYYSNITFLKIDSTLLFSYLFHNPFRISKEFLMLRGEENIYTFGETPLTTLDVIARECSLTQQDTVFELGCGRGRTCFWLNQFIGCTVIGVDFVPAFIQKAQKVQQRFQVQGVSFRLEDLFTTDLTGATVIYLYGTCYSAAEIEMLTERFSHLPKGSKIITVSYSLTEFVPSAPFRVIKQFPAAFTWGVGEVYLQVKN